MIAAVASVLDRFDRCAWKIERAEHPEIALSLRLATEAALRAVACGKREYRVAITPTLSEARWCGLMDILDPGLTGEQSGALRSKQQGPLRYVRAAHACGVPDGWEYDRAALEQGLADLPDTVFRAIVEIADRFWASALDDSRSPRRGLEDRGAGIARSRPKPTGRISRTWSGNPGRFNIGSHPLFPRASTALRSRRVEIPSPGSDGEPCPEAFRSLVCADPARRIEAGVTTMASSGGARLSPVEIVTGFLGLTGISSILTAIAVRNTAMAARLDRYPRTDDTRAPR